MGSAFAFVSGSPGSTPNLYVAFKFLLSPPADSDRDVK